MQTKIQYDEANPHAELLSISRTKPVHKLGRREEDERDQEAISVPQSQVPHTDPNTL